ncbi:MULTISPECIES: putative quinol monooxygenase [Corynebacterium]|jgi:quinol monooxygenase YgiN|uniref:putative quinol monooxygenase n=1 Tax=Corynebacterium TaxID=1716 RepID=UPI000A695383|nr:MULTISPECIES: putative quinol monooxygenase [Corynebacterium]MCI1256900.1 antibiotic biosynthesis monooxygenase [Corynebacterium provencense]
MTLSTTPLKSLTVDLRVREGHLEDFLRAIRENAERSFTDEPGCVYFDVSQDAEDELHFTFFELYTDQDAVAAHRAAPHFAEWRKAVELHVVPGSQRNVLADRLFHHQ